MAGYWEGFSEDDIKYYLDQNSDAPSNIDSSKTKTASLKVGGSKKTVVREKRLPSSKASILTSDAEISEAASLLKPTEVSSNIEKAGPKLSSTSTVPLEPTVLVTSCTIKPVLEEKLTENIETPPDPAKTLELFQARQKLLEEQNRQRKQFLTKILTDRKKQTSEEARRLHKIQEELQKLDILLSNDVGILRDEIEVAAMEFGEAQKRFNKAEKEFLEAKQLLFSKLERKELLTKHLCTIIEQNEVRKAEKLSELMNQLSIEPPALSSMSGIESNRENLSAENPAFLPEVATNPGVS